MPNLTAEQKRNIRKALKVARRRGASLRERKSLVEAMGVEARYGDPAYGDRDSEGGLQQRPSQGWGPASETLEQDVAQYLKAARAANTKGGSAGQLAQRVQRSGFPDRYDQRSGEADQILATYGGGGSAAPQRASQGTSRTTSKTTTTPGVDNAALRRQLVGQFLQQGGVANPGAVLTLAGSYGQAADIPGTSKTTYNDDASPSTSRSAAPRLRSSVTPLGGSKNAGNGAFNISGPDPGRLRSGVVSFAKKVAEVYGGSLEGSDGTGHSRLTTSGNVSEHSTGDATDIFRINGKPAQGRELLRAGRAALIAAGMPRAEALKAQGGLYNVGNHQIIFATNEGGNHFDHLHVSQHAGRSDHASDSSSPAAAPRAAPRATPAPRPIPATPRRSAPPARPPRPRRMTPRKDPTPKKVRLYAHPDRGQGPAAAYQLRHMRDQQ